MVKHFKIMLLAFLPALLVNVEQVAAQRAVIAIEGAEIYSLPWADGSPVSVLSRGDTVRVIGRRGQWVKLLYSEGKKGWMQIQVHKARASTNGKFKNGPGPVKAKKNFGKNGAAKNGAHKTNGATPDLVKRKPQMLKDEVYRRFGYSFGMGLMASDYTYNWKFVFHSTPKLALEGSFKHVLGDAADSYFIMSNLSYLLKENGKTLPYVTAGMGIINTVPDRNISTETVSNMAINYGLGARKLINQRLSVIVSASQYTVFVGKGISNFREIILGILVGKFWD